MHVAHWLKQLGLGKYVEKFEEQVSFQGVLGVCLFEAFAWFVVVVVFVVVVQLSFFAFVSCFLRRCVCEYLTPPPLPPQDIRGDVLLDLTNDECEAILDIRVLGHRKLLLKSLECVGLPTPLVPTPLDWYTGVPQSHPCQRIHTVYVRCVLHGGGLSREQSLRCWLLTPELQWQSRGKRRISQGRPQTQVLAEAV